MAQSSVIDGSSTLFKFVIGFGVIGFIVIASLFFYCLKRKGQDSNSDRRSSSNSIESFQQLFFKKISQNPIKNIEQPTIERWSSIDQPSTTFYRIYIQDNFDNYYQPVTEERLRSSAEQSKAMEYAGLETNFF